MPCLLAALFCAGLLASPSAAAEGGPSVRLQTIDGDPLAGRLAALDAEAVELVTPGGSRRVPLGAVRLLETATPVADALADVAHLRVHLVGGELLRGTWAGEVPEGLAILTPAFGRILIPFEALRTVVPVSAGAGPCHEPELGHPPRKDEDVAWTREGDAYTGIVLGADAEGWEVETGRDRVRRVAWDDLAVVHLQNDVLDAPQGLEVELETPSGSRLLPSKGFALDGDSIAFALRSVPARPLRVPLSSVLALRSRGGAFEYATHVPHETAFEPWFKDSPETVAWLERWHAARVDRRPTGCPLRLDGRVYRHGFAVHSRSRVTLTLDRAFVRFDAYFGVDDEALERPVGGVVDARILADGKEIWSAKNVRAGEQARVVGPLDITGVTTLVLEVDYGAEQHVRDRATWADPVLVRK